MHSIASAAGGDPSVAGGAPPSADAPATDAHATLRQMALLANLQRYTGLRIIETAPTAQSARGAKYLAQISVALLRR